jgi:hypothetical protein
MDRRTQQTQQIQHMQHRPAPQRFKGGFRQLVETDLGQEQLCASCGETWPTDNEFYVVGPTSMTYECKACALERRAKRRKTVPRRNISAVNEHLNKICAALFAKKDKKTPYVQMFAVE